MVLTVISSNIFLKLLPSAKELLSKIEDQLAQESGELPLIILKNIPKDRTFLSMLPSAAPKLLITTLSSILSLVS